MPAALIPTGWIHDRRFDALFFFGSALLPVVTGLLVLAAPVLLPWLWAAWLLLVDGPHLLATLTRTYFDARERVVRRALLMASLLLFVPGFGVLGWSWLQEDRRAWELFLGFATLWAWHHTVRQNYGILSIYASLARATPHERRLDSGFLYLWMWAAFGLFLLAHPVNRRVLGLPDPLPGAARAVLVGGAACLGALTLLYVSWLVIRARRGRAVRPALFALVATFGSAAFPLLVLGPFEPLAESAQTPEHVFLGVTLTGGVLHGVQYLGIVLAANRRRFHQHPERSLAALLGRTPLRAYGVFAALSVLYVGLNFARGGAPETSLFPAESPPAQLLLALYWGVFFHHYYLDQRIWRVRQQPSLQYELGLREAT